METRLSYPEITGPVAAPATAIRSVARAARLLSYVAEHEAPSATECARALAVPLPTAHHLLSTLVTSRLLAKDAQRRYRLGPAVGALADAFHRHALSDDRLLVPLRQLAATTAETAHLGGWRHGDVVVLASVEGVQALRVASLHTGMEGAAHARATGKLLLALASAPVRDAYLATHRLDALTARTITSRDELEREFERIRRAGHAVDEEEFAPGVACVSAPIVSRGELVGAYSVSAPAARFRERRRWLAEAARHAATAGAALLAQTERAAG